MIMQTQTVTKSTQESDQSNWWVNHLVQFVAKPVCWKEKGRFVHGTWVQINDSILFFGWTIRLKTWSVQRLLKYILYFGVYDKRKLPILELLKYFW